MALLECLLCAHAYSHRKVKKAFGKMNNDEFRILEEYQREAVKLERRYKLYVLIHT